MYQQKAENSKATTDQQIKNVSSYKRPKRCYVCQKMINSIKYDAHVKQCCSDQKQKVQKDRQSIRVSTRPKIQKAHGRQIIQANPIIKSRPSPNMTKEYNSKFRISNRPSNGTILANKSLPPKTTSNKIASSSFGKGPLKSIQQNPQKGHLTSKEKSTKINKKQVKETSVAQEKVNSNSDKNIKEIWKDALENSCDVEIKPNENNDDIEVKQEKPKQNSDKVSEELQSLELEQNHQSNNIQQEQQQFDPVAPNNTFRIQVEIDNDSYVVPQRPVQPVQLIRQQQFEQRTSSFAQMARLTSQIIDFIGRVGITDDPTLNIMIEQLHHINQISQQIQELNQVGNSLGFTMEALFGSRVQDLHSIIINQVSFAVLRSFSNRQSAEFQGLMYIEFVLNFRQRNPQLRQGFTKTQISQKFPVSKSQKQGQCAICLQQYEIESEVIKLQCFHEFHSSCIQQWLDTSKNCPLCRKVQT